MKEKIKIYDKNINTTSNKIRAVVIVMVLFAIGFATGYFINISEKEDIINSQYKEIEDLKEQLQKYEVKSNSI